MRQDRQLRPGRRSVLRQWDRIGLAPGKSEGRCALPGEELQRQNPHPDQIRTVDSLEALRDHRSDAQQPRPLGRPVARRAGAVFLASDHEERHVLRRVAHRRFEDRCGLATGQVHRERPFPLGQRVAQPDVGEGAAHHDLVVAAPRSVTVELEGRHAVSHEPLSGGGPGCDRAGGRDVVGGHGVAQERQHAPARDPRHGFRFGSQPHEKGRPGHVRGVVVPAVAIADRNIEGSPARIAVEYGCIGGAEEISVDGRPNGRANLLGRWPEVPEVDRRAAAVHAERLRRKVDVNRSGQGEGDDQRR